jgi:hypothetical protein
MRRGALCALAAGAACAAFALACSRDARVVEAPVMSASAAALAMAPYMRDAEAPDEEEPPGELHEGDRFVGEYMCPQGATKMVLSIDAAAPGKRGVQAVFEFHHEPTSVRGSYRMRGSFDPETGRVELVQDAWVRRPMGYNMTDLEGQLRGGTLNGRILTKGCGPFTATLED